MSAATSHSLPYDPATVEFDPLLRRLNLANTRRRWRQLLERAQTHGWSCREFLGVLITEEISHRPSPTDPHPALGQTGSLPVPEDRRGVRLLLPVQCAPAVPGQLSGTDLRA